MYIQLYPSVSTKSYCKFIINEDILMISVKNYDN